MKKILLASAVILSSLGVINAQNATTRANTETVKATTPAARTQETLTKITRACNPTADQTGKLNTLLLDFYTKMDALKASKSTMDEKVFDTKKKELRNNRDASLKAILTPAQQAKLESLKKDGKN